MLDIHLALKLTSLDQQKGRVFVLIYFSLTFSTMIRSHLYTIALHLQCPTICTAFASGVSSNSTVQWNKINIMKMESVFTVKMKRMVFSY